MKNFLLPLLAALALPTVANAESVWLILHTGHVNTASLEKIKMKDKSQCELMGAKWKTANFSKHPNPTVALNYHNYICLVGE